MHSNKASVEALNHFLAQSHLVSYTLHLNYHLMQARKLELTFCIANFSTHSRHGLGRIFLNYLLAAVELV
jgi:hypothetical protein